MGLSWGGEGKQTRNNRLYKWTGTRQNGTTTICQVLVTLTLHEILMFNELSPCNSIGPPKDEESIDFTKKISL